MDEIDAALDFRNVSIVANYIKDRTKNAQFIIISLRSVSLLVPTLFSDILVRNDMFELSQRLIGIYKTSNATKSVFCRADLLPVLTVSQLFPSITVHYLVLLLLPNDFYLFIFTVLNIYVSPELFAWDRSESGTR